VHTKLNVYVFIIGKQRNCKNRH